MHNLIAGQLKTLPIGEYGDGRGLYFFVEEGRNGTLNRRFAFRWKTPDGKRPWKNIGPLDRVTLSEARRIAGDWLDMVRNNKDPRATDTGKLTLKTFIDQHLDSWTRGKSAGELKNWEYAIRRMEPLHDKPIADIAIADVLPWVKPLWDKLPVTTSRTLGKLAMIFNASIALEVREKANPASWSVLKKVLPDPREVQPIVHHASLDYDEVPAFLRKLRYDETNSARCALFAILTAVRSQEARGARWSEIDFNKKVWTVPAERMKAGRQHRVPLSTHAIKLLQSMPKVGELVFPSEKEFGKHVEMQSNALTRTVQKTHGSKLSLHGFRSSFRRYIADKVHADHKVVEACLAHQIADNAVEAAYLDGADMLSKRRNVMQAWADFVTGVTPMATVLPFAREPA